jgi:hypothetical protein
MNALDSRGGGVVLQPDVVEAFQRAGIPINALGVATTLSLVLYAAISLYYLLPGVIDRQLTRFDLELSREEEEANEF